jgi:hypothetical protein
MVTIPGNGMVASQTISIKLFRNGKSASAASSVVVAEVVGPAVEAWH